MSTDGVHKVPHKPPLDLPHLPVMQATGKTSTLADWCRRHRTISLNQLRREHGTGRQVGKKEEKETRFQRIKD